MHLTRFTDLGLRILSYLAAESHNGDLGSRSGDLDKDATVPDSAAASPPTRITASSVSEAINASHTHVAKVISRLAEIGVIHSTRGRTGGIRLDEDALDYPLGDLIRALEFTSDRPREKTIARAAGRTAGKAKEFFEEASNLVQEVVAETAQLLPGNGSDADSAAGGKNQQRGVGASGSDSAGGEGGAQQKYSSMCASFFNSELWPGDTGKHIAGFIEEAETSYYTSLNNYRISDLI